MLTVNYVAGCGLVVAVGTGTVSVGVLIRGVGFSPSGTLTTITSTGTLIANSGSWSTNLLVVYGQVPT